MEVGTRKYEWTIVILFACNWGLVMMDRGGISYVFPVLMKVFHMNNAAIGTLGMVNALAFAVFSIIMGLVSDKTGYRKGWLVPATLLASVFTGAAAFAGAFSSLLIIRGLAGIAEGPVMPIQTSLLMSQGDPQRYATNIGWIQVATGLFAAIIGPIYITQVAAHSNWHFSLVAASIPALIVGILMWIFVKEVDRNKEDTKAKSSWAGVGLVFGYRNVVLSIIACCLVSMGFWGCMYYVTIFWVKVGHMSLVNMGYLMSLFGVFGLGWAIVIPLISNRIGRRPTGIIFSLVSAVPLVVMGFSAGLFAQILFAVLFGVVTYMTIFFFATVPTESVPIHLAATATGVVMAFEEIVGTAIVPKLMGSIADAYGYHVVFLWDAVWLVLAAIASIFLIETRKRARTGKATGAVDASPS